MNRLKGHSVYLIGAIDRSFDRGASWREQLTDELINLGIAVYNPLKKPCDQANELEFHKERFTWKSTGQYDLLSRHVREIRHIDLRMVDKSDFLIVYIDMDIFMCGSFEEIAVANLQHKPVLVWCKQGKNNLPDWLFGQLKHQLFFSSMGELLQYLDLVDKGNNIDYLDRWVFFKQPEN